MFASNTFSDSSFARMSERANWLEALPKILVLPGGALYANYLIFRSILSLRGSVGYMKAMLASREYEAAPQQRRMQCAEMTARHMRILRRIMMEVRSLPPSGFLSRLLLAWLDSIIEDYSDLAETFALGADPEMQSLAKELSDVL
jgi:hypothetical protein